MPSDLSSFADIPFNDSYLSAREFASGGLITLFRERFHESSRECQFFAKKANGGASLLIRVVKLGKEAEVTWIACFHGEKGNEK